MDWSKIKTACGIVQDVTDETAEPLVLAAVDGFKKKYEDSEKALKALQLSHEPHAPDPVLVKLASENRTAKINALVMSARITKAVADDLSAQFIGKDNGALVLALSKSKNSTDPDGFDAICAALAKNDVVELKEKSGPQLLELSREVGKPASLVQDAEARAKKASGK